MSHQAALAEYRQPAIKKPADCSMYTAQEEAKTLPSRKAMMMGIRYSMSPKMNFWTLRSHKLPGVYYHSPKQNLKVGLTRLMPQSSPKPIWTMARVNSNCSSILSVFYRVIPHLVDRLLSYFSDNQYMRPLPQMQIGRRNMNEFRAIVRPKQFFNLLVRLRKLLIQSLINSCREQRYSTRKAKLLTTPCRTWLQLCAPKYILLRGTNTAIRKGTPSKILYGPVPRYSTMRRQQNVEASQLWPLGLPQSVGQYHCRLFISSLVQYGLDQAYQSLAAPSTKTLRKKNQTMMNMRNLLLTATKRTMTSRVTRNGSTRKLIQLKSQMVNGVASCCRRQMKLQPALYISSRMQWLRRYERPRSPSVMRQICLLLHCGIQNIIYQRSRGYSALRGSIISLLDAFLRMSPMVSRNLICIAALVSIMSAAYRYNFALSRSALAEMMRLWHSLAVLDTIDKLF